VVIFNEFTEADATIEGSATRLGLALPRGGQLTVFELRQCVDAALIEPAASGVPSLVGLVVLQIIVIEQPLQQGSRS
jgi:hypothetical protein